MIYSPSQTVPSGYRRLATASAFIGLFAFAVILAITPAAINQIGRFYHARPSVLGILYLVQAAGFLITVVAGGWLSDKRGKFPVMIIGSVLMAAGAALFGRTSSFAVVFAAIFLMGAGGGLTEGVAMAAVADLYGGPRRTAMLNWAQVAFALGAVTSPFVIAELISSGLDWRLGYIGTAVMCMISAFGAMAVAARRLEVVHVSHEEHEGWPKLLSDHLLIALSIGILLYVGAESGQYSWAATYFREALKASAPLAASSVAFFWGGVGAGRITATWVSRYISEVSLICFTLAFTAVSQIILLALHAPIPGLAAVFAFGFFLGPVWPTILARAGEAFPRQSGTVFGILVAMGAVGSAIVPPIVGWVGDMAGIRTALSICVVLLVGNFLLFLRLRFSEDVKR